MEADVPEENPPAVTLGESRRTHQVVREQDDCIVTACGRSVSSDRQLIRSAWIDVDYRFACRDCARATGLSELDTEIVLSILRAKLGELCYVEVCDPPESLPMTDLPTIEISPRDPAHTVPGHVTSYFRHLNYAPAGTSTDHRGAPLLRFSPILRGEVQIMTIENDA